MHAGSGFLGLPAVRLTAQDTALVEPRPPKTGGDRSVASVSGVCVSPHAGMTPTGAGLADAHTEDVINSSLDPLWLPGGDHILV